MQALLARRRMRMRSGGVEGNGGHTVDDIVHGPTPERLAHAATALSRDRRMYPHLHHALAQLLRVDRSAQTRDRVARQCRAVLGPSDDFDLTPALVRLSQLKSTPIASAPQQ